MDKDTKILLTLSIVIIIVIIGIFYIKNSFKETITEAEAICIGEHSVLYSQTTCSHCITQKEMFGNYVDKLNITECDKNMEACAAQGITGTPTWIINGTKYEGVQTLKKLKELTGCK